MLEIGAIRSRYDELVAGLKLRKAKIGEEHLRRILALEDERKSLQTEQDLQQSKINEHSRQIGQLYKSGQAKDAEALKQSVSELKEIVDELDKKSKQVKHDLGEALLEVPNIPHTSVPAGSTDADNELVREGNQEIPTLPEGARPHWELGEIYGILDFPLGVKITGAGFPVYRGQGARLQRALINFFLDEARAAGYEEIQPPLLVNEDTARATGQLPDKEGQMYHVTLDDLYLIPTAEVPVTNILRSVTLEEADLPVKLTGYTPCFRREAGSYGADVKGLNRVHQFDKVEIVQVADPAESYQVLQEMVAQVEQLLIKLELPYRIVRLCGGDLGFTSALTFDFEVYAAAQKRWLEVSSVSNFEAFQSNRLKLKIKKKGEKPYLAHTLNGSALALARIFATLLENNQHANGIRIPKALQPYTGFSDIQNG